VGKVTPGALKQSQPQAGFSFVGFFFAVPINLTNRVV
jgi:hypothetical protein